MNERDSTDEFPSEPMVVDEPDDKSENSIEISPARFKQNNSLLSRAKMMTEIKTEGFMSDVTMQKETKSFLFADTPMNPGAVFVLDS